MLNDKGSHYCRIPASAHFFSLILLVTSAVLISQSACFFKKKVNPQPVSLSPVRVVLLPFTVPQNDKDLRWAALAAPILMAKVGEHAQGLDIVPLWESMPTAINAAGGSRTFTEQSAANIATWHAAKWTVWGELAPSKNGYSVTVDFIPSRSNLVPFRYLKSGKLDSIGAGFYDAYSQFLRYLVSKPLEPARTSDFTLTSMKDLAEALDREYGWFVEAEPGKAQDAAANLLRSDEALARSLFSPALYPLLAKNK